MQSNGRVVPSCDWVECNLPRLSGRGLPEEVWLILCMARGYSFQGNGHEIGLRHALLCSSVFYVPSRDSNLGFDNYIITLYFHMSKDLEENVCMNYIHTVVYRWVDKLW